VAAANAFILRWLPGPLAWLVAEGIGLLVLVFALGHEWRIRKKPWGLFRNQRIVFRDRWNRRLAARLVVAWARHMGRFVVDFFWLPRLHAGNLARFVDLTEFARVKEIHDEGKGILCVTGHIGMPELCGHVSALQGVTTAGVYRPIPLQPIDALVTSIRTSGGQRVLSKWGVLWSLKKALDRGELVGLAADENTFENPLFVPFLGTLAATTTTAPLLHLTTGAPLAVVSVHRTGWRRFKVHVWEVVRHAPSGDRAADLAAVARRMNDGLSRAILAYPPQWFWGSQRYRNRPPVEAPFDSAMLPPCAPLPT